MRHLSILKGAASCLLALSFVACSDSDSTTKSVAGTVGDITLDLPHDESEFGVERCEQEDRSGQQHPSRGVEHHVEGLRDGESCGSCEAVQIHDRCTKNAQGAEIF